MRGTVFFAKNFLIRNTIPPPKSVDCPSVFRSQSHALI